MAKYTAKSPEIIKLVKRLEKYSMAYHNTGKPLVSDAEYDKLLAKLEKHVPSHPFLKKVGAPIKRGAKVKLPYFMPSLDKIYPDKGADSFLEHSSGVIDVLDKLDGTSALLDNNPSLILYTRGNGSIGQNISKLIPSLKKIGKLKKKEAVRGELLIDNNTFQSKWASEFENARNLVSGIANSKSVHKAASNIDFVIHEFVNPHLPWHKARVKLKSAGFDTVYTKRFNKPTIKDLEDHLAKRRKDSKYDIDGLVLIDVKTGSRISFKVNAPSQKAIVDHIEWKLSKNAIYKPVVVLKKAIKIGGVSVKRATAHNAKRVMEWGIGPGAVVQIVRSGDVIPKLVGVIKKAKPSLPTNFKWDSNKVEAIADKLSKKDNVVVETKKLTESFKILGIDGIRQSVAEQLIKAGYDLVDCFYALEKDFKNIGIGNANSATLYKGLESVRKTVTHTTMMWASQCWPKGFTDTKFDLVLGTIPFSKMVKLSDAKLIQIISKIHGFSESSARIFVEHLPDYEEFLDEFEELNWKPKNPKAINTKGKLSGKSFVFTKVRSKELEAEIKKHGGTVSGSINKNTTGVITKSAMEGSTKITKARSLGISIHTLNGFKKKYGL